jgi:hypothetical protein
MRDAGRIVLAGFTGPFRSDRALVRGLYEPGEFLKVFVDAPLAVVEARDPQGLHAQARRGGDSRPYRRRFPASLLPPTPSGSLRSRCHASPNCASNRVGKGMAPPPGEKVNSPM